MLPFLKRTQDAAAAGPVQKIERKPDDDGAEPEFDMLETAAEELCHALEAKDYKGAASALRAAFQMLEAEPHEEGEHT